MVNVQDQRLWLLYVVVAVLVGLVFGRAQWREQSQPTAAGPASEPDIEAWVVVVIAAIAWPIVLPISLVTRLSKLLPGRS